MFNLKINNILFITIDSLRFDRVGHYADVKDKTPTIDFFIKNGISCINTSSHGCPTQIAMPSVMSSSLPLDYGGYDHGIKKRPAVLAEILQKNNFNTAGFSSGSALTSYFGYDRGFDQYFQFTSIDLLWFSYRKLYFQYFLNLRKNNAILEKEFLKAIHQFLNNLFTFFIDYCENIMDQINKHSIVFDDSILSRNYDSVKSAIINEKNKLDNDPTNYIYENLDRLAIKTTSYDPKLSNLDFYNYFFHRSNSLGTTYKIKKYLLEEILKKLINKCSWDWLKINREYEGMSDDSIIINNTIRWMENNNNDKTFIWAHLIDLHGKKYNNNIFQLPLLAKGKKKIFQKNSNKSYDLSLNQTDKNIKKLINFYSEKKLLEKTLIIISADHGHEAGFPNRKLGIGSAPFYEEYIHIPLIFYHPGIKPKTIDYQCCSMDIAPTILDLVDIKIPDEFQGLPVYSSDIAERDNILLEHTHRGPNDIRNKPFYIAVKSDGYKLIWKEYIYHRDPSPEQFEMYELNNDPHEQSNIYSNPSFYDIRMYLEDIVKKRFSELNKERNESPNVN